jgi:hypothetical protein
MHMGQILAVIFHKLTKNLYFCRFGKIMTGVKFFPVSQGTVPAKIAHRNFFFAISGVVNQIFFNN